MWPGTAEADVYTSEHKGVVRITSYKPKRGKILNHIKGEGEARPTASKRPKVKGKRRARSKGGKVMVPASFVPMVQQAAEHYQLPEALIWAVMKIESGFNPRAVSNKGAQGLMQLMPGTAGDMGVTDAFDPQQNILGGARYLRILANQFDGDLVLTLSGYHAGGGAVGRNSTPKIPYEQTAKYVRAVLNAYYQFKDNPPVPGR
ncbi:MAG: lytic transglycosylase domain-containing protein [Bradymonadia bacterium]